MVDCESPRSKLERLKRQRMERDKLKKIREREGSMEYDKYCDEYG